MTIRTLVAVATLYSAISVTAFAQLPPPPKELTPDSNGVDLRTGNLTYRFTDLTIGPANEFGLSLERFMSEGVVRDSFSSTYHLSNYSDGNWTEVATLGNSGGSLGLYTSTPGIFVERGDSPRLQRQDGSIVDFGLFMWDQNGTYGDYSSDSYRLATRVRFSNGVEWHFHYKVVQSAYFPNVRLRAVTTNTGYQIRFNYLSDLSPGSSGWLTRVSATAVNTSVEYCNPEVDSCTLTSNWPTVRYENRSSTNPITSDFIVTSPEGQVTTYRGVAPFNNSPGYYSISKGGLGEIARYTFKIIYTWCDAPGATLCSGGNTNRVSSFTNPFKTTSYSYPYNDARKEFLQINAIEQDGGRQTLITQGPIVSGLRRFINALGAESRFEYDKDSQLTTATSPENSRTEWTRDVNGNVTEQRAYSKDGSRVLTFAWKFGLCRMGVPTCSKPETVTNAKGAITTFVNDPAHGGVTRQEEPAGRDGIRSVLRRSYVQRRAWLASSSGGYVQSSTAIWLPYQERTCRTTATLGETCAGGAADETVTTYDYGPDNGTVGNNLLVRSSSTTAAGVTIRNCYGYDRFGNRIYETKPRSPAACY